jgi:hypothetical protein
MLNWSADRGFVSRGFIVLIPAQIAVAAFFSIAINVTGVAVTWSVESVSPPTTAAQSPVPTSFRSLEAPAIDLRQVHSPSQATQIPVCEPLLLLIAILGMIYYYAPPSKCNVVSDKAHSEPPSDLVIYPPF